MTGPHGYKPKPFKSESFHCLNCGRHIPDAMLTRYTAKRTVGFRQGAVAGPGAPRQITEEQREEIRARRAAGEPCQKIAADLGISASAVSQIARRKGTYEE